MAVGTLDHAHVTVRGFPTLTETAHPLCLHVLLRSRKAEFPRWTVWVPRMSSGYFEQDFRGMARDDETGTWPSRFSTSPSPGSSDRLCNLRIVLCSPGWDDCSTAGVEEGSSCNRRPCSAGTGT